MIETQRNHSYTRTKATPVTVAGIIFHNYRAGIGTYRWISEDGRIHVSDNYSRLTYRASVDGETIGRRFRSKSGAMRAAIDVMRKKRR